MQQEFRRRIKTQARHSDHLLSLFWTSSFDDVLSYNRQYSCSRRSREQLEGTNRSRNTSNTTRVNTENNTTKVIDPRAVTSIAAIVSHGIRVFATASRIALSIAPTSPSMNSLVMRTNAKNASAAPPNQRERRTARAENKDRLMDLTSGTNRHSSNKLRIGTSASKSSKAKLLPSSRRRRLPVGGNSDEMAIERNGPIDR